MLGALRLLACGTLLLLVPGTPAMAREYVAGAIKVSQAWTRVTPQGAKVAGGFLTVTNTGKEPDRLVGGSAAIAGAFEIHEMIMDGGIMRMRALEKGLEIKPGETVVLRPGSYHVMLLGLRAEPKLGEPVKATLHFEKAGRIEIELVVEPLGAAQPRGHAGHR
jgi:hypothetical protein